MKNGTLLLKTVCSAFPSVVLVSFRNITWCETT